MSAPLPRSSRVGSADMDLGSTLLYEPDASSADSLVSTNNPDDLANEQTWPTDEEMNGVQEDNVNGNANEDSIPDAPTGTTPRTVKRIPKGMSEYQATWIVEDDEEDDGGEGGDDDDTGEMDGRDEEEMVDLPHAADDDGDTEKGVTFMDLDVEEEERQYVLPSISPRKTCSDSTCISLDLTRGAREIERTLTTLRFLTKSTLPKTSQHGPAFSVTEGCARSERAPGIRMKISRGTMRGSSNSKISRGQSVRCGAARRKRLPLFR